MRKTKQKRRAGPKGSRPKASVVREEAPHYGNGTGAGKKFRFIDLFCGIGGFRLAFERTGAECVFSSDWDKHSQTTYQANFGDKPHGDIHEVAVADIPPHDILCAGFPCQPFSIAGVSKKLSLGRKHGFDDEKLRELLGIVPYIAPAQNLDPAAGFYSTSFFYVSTRCRCGLQFIG